MKKKIWIIPIYATVYEKVVFSEPVTKEEALDLYLEGEIEDIIDQDISPEEPVEDALGRME